MSLTNIIADIREIKSGRKELREFGITIGVILLVISGLALWRGRESYPYFGVTGIIFIGSGLIAPAALKPLQKVWMALSVVIGFFMSRLVLTALFFGVITPIGLLTKVLGKDILDRRLDRWKPSYWREGEVGKREKKSYENQY